MNEKDFDRLVRKLKSSDRCMLILGPEFINIDSHEVDFTVSIQDYLAKKSFPGQDPHYIGEDGFLFFRDQEYREMLDTLDELSEFYKKLPLTQSYELLARIPFTSIISLSPDNLIVQAYKKINRPYKFCKFKNEGFEDAPLESSKEMPMIYNLMGDHSNSNILVFTFDNLFRFLDKLFQDSGSENLKKHISETSNFLFLGFNFHKWYLKLFFYFLKKSKGSNPNQPLRDAIFNYKVKEDQFQSKIQYYKATYDLIVSPENEREFIQALFNECDKNGILTAYDSNRNEKTVAVGEERYRIQFFGSEPAKKGATKSGDKFVSIMKIVDNSNCTLLEPVLDLKQGEIAPLIDKRKPNLIYFNCHGTTDGKLILSLGDKTADYLPIGDLKDIVDTVLANNENKQINCIVFSVCQSEQQSQQLSQSIPYCIGMCDFVDIEVSAVFTQGFFEALIGTSDQDITHAFNMGVLALKTCGTPAYREYANIPVLYINGQKYMKKSAE